MRAPCDSFVRWACSVLLTLALSFPALAQQPITFQYFYDELGQLIKVVDSTGVMIEYVYDAVGNILEIKRSTIAGLAILDFSPRQGPIGTTVTIQGRGFSATPADDLVQFNGVTATVTAATATTLVVTVPPGATTGPIIVQVGADAATSSSDFAVTRIPTITSVRPIAAFAGTAIPDVQISGTNLAGATFAFIPPFAPPAITVDAATIDPGGTSATLRVTVSPSAVGQFVVVATNAEGSSDPFASARNSLIIIDPNRGDVDSDGDQFVDALEVLLGSNPADPQSIPKPDVFITEAGAPTFSIANTIDLTQASLVTETVGVVFSVENTTDPGQAALVTEAVGPVFSVENTTDPGQTAPVTEAVSPTFSVQNEP